MVTRVDKYLGGLGIDATGKLEVTANASVVVGNGTSTGNVYAGTINSGGVELRANDYATLLSARSNDYSTYLVALGGLTGSNTRLAGAESNVIALQGGLSGANTINTNQTTGLTGANTNITALTGGLTGANTAIALRALAASPTFTGNTTFDTNTLFVDSLNDRVGIGTVSPVAQLTVTLGAVVSGDGSYFGGGAYYDTVWKNSVSSQGGWAVRNTGGVFTIYTDVSPGTAGSTLTGFQERMRVNGSGNVSIGTASSFGKLIVYGDAVNFSPTADSANNGIGACIFGQSVATATSAVARLYMTGYNTDHAGSLDLRSGAIIGSTINMYNTAGTKTVYFNTNSDSYINGGNMGIGTSSPITKLNLIDALSGGQLLVATNQTDATEKYGTFGTQHYTNTEEPALGLAVQSSVTDNIILIGGALGEFNAATQVRFYTAANNTTVAGTERMRIDSSGNVGIGSTNPSGAGGTKNLLVESNGITIIKVYTSSTTTGTARLDYATGTPNSYVVSSLNDNTGAPYYSLSSGAGVTTSYTDFTTQIWRNTGGGTEYMRINSSGNVGIGTATPSNKLVVNTTSQYTGIVLNNTTNTVAYMVGTSATNDDGQLVLSSGGVPKVNLLANGTSYINGGGNMGIGTTSPSYKLQVVNGSIYQSQSDGSMARIGLSNSNRAWTISNYGTSYSPNGGFIIADETAAAVRMVIDTSGNMGIGTVSPSDALSVARSSGEAVISITNSGTASSWLTLSPGSSGSAYIHNTGNTSTVFTTNGTERMRIGASGNVGIGTSSPTAKLDVNGTISASNINRTYALAAVGGSASWIKLGTFTAGQGGHHCFIKVVTSVGYNAATAQDNEIYIHFKTSNGTSVDANGFAGFTQFYITNTAGITYDVKVVGNAAGVSATSYDIWLYQAGAYNGTGAFYTVEINNTTSTWTNVSTTGADPGVASSTIGIGTNGYSIQSNVSIVGALTTSGTVTLGSNTNVKITGGSSGQVLSTDGSGNLSYATVQGVPVASIIMYGANTAPSGWLVCDGTAVSRSTYSGLFAVVSNVFGIGDNTTTFNLPDFRGRSPYGVDASQSITIGAKSVGKINASFQNSTGTGTSGSGGPTTHSVTTVAYQQPVLVKDQATNGLVTAVGAHTAHTHTIPALTVDHPATIVQFIIKT